MRWSFGRRDTNVSSPLYYPKSLTVTIPVHDNVASTFLTHRGQASAETWFAPDGRKLATKRERRPPQPRPPGPQTILSRRAEHDPSTPNPVYLAPATTTQSRPSPTYGLTLTALLNHGIYELAVASHNKRLGRRAQ